MTLDERDEMIQILKKHKREYVPSRGMLTKDSNGFYFDIDLPFNVVEYLFHTPLAPDDGVRTYPNCIERILYEQPVVCASLVDGDNVLYPDYYWDDTYEMLTPQEKREAGLG